MFMLNIVYTSRTNMITTEYAVYLMFLMKFM